MPKYIKANPKVVEFLGLTSVRPPLPDGNYLLWQADVFQFGSAIYLDSVCRKIGAIALSPIEAKQEQDGKACRTLPAAEDARFIVPAAPAEELEPPFEEIELPIESEAEVEPLTEEEDEPGVSE